MSWVSDYKPKAGGAVVQAARVTKKNAEELTAWCAGTLVTTYDAIDFADKEGEVGINFEAKNGMERVSENEFLVKIDEHEFKRYAANHFLHLYESV